MAWRESLIFNLRIGVEIAGDLSRKFSKAGCYSLARKIINLS